MRLVKLWFVPFLMLLTLFQSYPQYMLISTKNNKNNVDIRIVDKIFKENNNYLNIFVIIPEVVGSTNELGQNSINSEVLSYTEKWIKDVKKDLEVLFKDGIPPLNPYELVSKYTVTNIKNVISLYIDYYQFTGGAHGITVRKAYTIDNKDSGILGIKDLFKVGYNYKSVIDKEIQKQINKDKDKYFIGKDGFQGIDDKTNFYIKDGNLVIYYNQYEIAPYASGIPEFIINKDLFEGNFKYDKIN